MAQPIANTLKSPFTSTAGLVPAPKSASFGSPNKPLTVGGILGSIGGAFNSANSALPKLGQTPAPTTGPFGPISPVLQASANVAQNTPAIQPAKTVTNTGGNAPTGSTVASVNPNINYNAGVTSQTPQQGTPAAPVKGLFPNVVSSLAAKGSSINPDAQAALTDAANVRNNLNTSRQNEATALGQQGLAPIPMGDITGRQSVIRNQYNEQQTALSNQLGNDVQLGGLGNQVQSTQQSALGTAAGLAAPQSYGLLNQPYNPVEDTYGGGGAAGATNRATQAGNIQAAQSNAATGGTASTNSYAGIYNTANTNAANYSQQQSAINAVGSQALNLLNSIPGRSSSQFVNAKLNQLATQFSSPEYAAFNTAIQSLQARIGQALQAGEIPTAATGNAQAIANGNITVGALSSTLQQVDQEMGAFVKTQSDLANYAKGQIGSGTSVSGFGWQPQ